MGCSSPLLAADLGIDSDTGKRHIKILNTRRLGGHWTDFQSYKDTYGDKLLCLPCGKCEGCILARRKMWALRCYCESLYHEQNCFLTLTYDDVHLPKTLVKADFQNFIKALRNRGLKFRYFGCGEYGGKTGRPHYHVILFGYFPDDAKYFSLSESGFHQFTSKFLSSVWSKGFLTFSCFTAETAAYTAGYVDKKYKMRDCFVLMSKRPGIAEQYFIDHHDEIYQNDSLVVNFGSHIEHVPKYFDKLAEKIGIDISDKKDFRIQQMNYLNAKQMRDISTIHFEDLLKKRKIDYKDKLDRKKRCL